MAFNINEFRSQMVGDGARPNLFSFTLIFPSNVGITRKQDSERKLTFMARAASIPQSIMGVARQNYFGREVKFAGDRIFPAWNVNIINDEDYLVRDAFEEWMNSLNNHETNIRRQSALSNFSYTTAQAYVTQYSKVGDPLKSYYFNGMFPTQLDPINLDWGANDRIEEFGVTFEYQYWIAETTPAFGTTA
jgi:hypothetical protein